MININTQELNPGLRARTLAILCCSSVPASALNHDRPIAKAAIRYLLEARRYLVKADEMPPVDVPPRRSAAG